MVENSAFATLPDPSKDRAVTQKDCPGLIHKPLHDNILFKDGKPDWEILKDFLAREGPVTKPQCMKILRQAIEVFKLEPNLC
jgi:hypothetical protein